MNTDTLIKINQEVSQYGGTFGVRDITLIQSAIGRGYMAELYGKDGVAAIFESLIKNHPFIDGNKRTAVVYLMYSLMNKGFLYNCDHWYLAKIVDNIAANKVDIDDAMNAIYFNSDRIQGTYSVKKVMNIDLVKNTLDILARKDSDDLTEQEQNWFNR